MCICFHHNIEVILMLRGECMYLNHFKQQEEEETNEETDIFELTFLLQRG
jgi:hypothetical protein